jgi:signal transduction histidine kinase
VYKQCTGDEIGELNQAFNQMVSDLRENLTKLEQANLEKSRLERLSLLGQMSAQVAHEIKNPLNAIKGSAHYLKANFQGAMLQEFLGVIENESERLSDIVTNFLNFSKPGPAVMQPSDLNAMVRDTLRLVEGEAGDKGSLLRFEADERISTLRFDYAKLKQSLLNLVVNAIQASQHGGVIRVSTEIANGEVHLSVTDQGSGIDSETLDNLFKPFFTTKVRGSGLGLAIAEQNVREHQGRIEVASQPGAGTRFTIILPWVET